MRILYLAHRVPYPPDRGDRIRSYHLLRWLSARHDVHLACLADEPTPPQAAEFFAAHCDGATIHRVDGSARWLRAAWSFGRGGSLTEGAFYSPSLAATLQGWARRCDFDLIVAMCSSMAQYLALPGLHEIPALVDLVDVDSAKWRDYSLRSHGLKRWVYRAESHRVRKLEQSLARRAAVIVVSDAEAEIFRRCCSNVPVTAIGNGVNLDYFAPVDVAASPLRLVFVGVLDYLPNVDGMSWFCREVWPSVIAKFPDARLTLVGRNPSPACQRLTTLPGVSVAANVPDVRPYLADAALAIVPLRIARGVQNKVLEAMAMGKAVVASPEALEGLDVEAGHDVVQAETVQEWQDTLSKLLASPSERQRLGQAARRTIEARYQWEGRLQPLTALLEHVVRPAAPRQAHATDAIPQMLPLATD